MQKQRLGKGLRFATLLKVTGSGVLCGVCFGFVMSIVSNGFVIGVKWLTELREANPFGLVSFAGKELSLAPLISLDHSGIAHPCCSQDFPYFPLAWSGGQHLCGASY